MNTSIRTVIRALTLGLLAVAGAITNPHDTAHAAYPDREAVRVRISDLNLATPRGTAILYERIRNAARTVCGPVDIALVEEVVVWDKCVDQSIANAVAKVDNANLTAYYLAHTRRHAIAKEEIAQAGHAH